MNLNEARTAFDEAIHSLQLSDEFIAEFAEDFVADSLNGLSPCVYVADAVRLAQDDLDDVRAVLERLAPDASPTESLESAIRWCLAALVRLRAGQPSGGSE